MGDYPTAPLPRAGSPEEAGVSSAEVLRFVEDLQKSGIENHSYMVLRGGRVAAEAFHEPFAPDLPHPMYSVSKTVTAIAVGFAIEEGFSPWKPAFWIFFRNICQSRRMIRSGS